MGKSTKSRSSTIHFGIKNKQKPTGKNETTSCYHNQSISHPLPALNLLIGLCRSTKDSGHEQPVGTPTNCTSSLHFFISTRSLLVISGQAPILPKKMSAKTTCMKRINRVACCGDLKLCNNGECTKLWTNLIATRLESDASRQLLKDEQA